MKVRKLLIYLANLPQFILLKIKYRSKIMFSTQQKRWEKGLKFVVKNNSAHAILIGKNNNYRSGFRVGALNGGKVRIGDNVFCNTNVSITARGSVSIADNVQIANNVVIIDHDHDYLNDGQYRIAPIVIERNVWVGANVVILKGVHIGEHAVIAAGAVVNSNVCAYSVWGGGPR